MKRLTTDNPSSNFETMLNYVYGKDGFAHIRFDGEQDDVSLTAWAKAQCLYRGCDYFPAETPEEIDETLCDCVMYCSECPIALAYCFASQAVHLRSRLKMYEDILFDGEGKELVTVEKLKELVSLSNNEPLTLEELREMDGEPVWVERIGDASHIDSAWALVNREHCLCRTSDGSPAFFELYGKAWLAYCHKQEEGVAND